MISSANKKEKIALKIKKRGNKKEKEKII